MSKFEKSLIVFIAITFMGAAFIPAYAQSPGLGPMMPEQDETMPPGRGFIPPSMDLSHLTADESPGNFRKMVLPTRFDWRETGKVSPVKNQGSCGSCYSFASLANIEAKMLIDGKGAFDFSENNAKECNFFDYSCFGGNYIGMANLFSQKGVVLESCDAYVASNVTCNTSCTYQKTLLGWKLISSSSVPSTAALQNYIYDNGPVYTSFYAGNSDPWESEIGSYDGSYVLYYTGGEDVNHAVLIVGWDDTLSHAGGTGAWIVKNSWGTSWGGTCDYGAESGYFYMAYGTASMGKWSSYMDSWQDYEAAETLDYYDEAGWVQDFGYNDPIVHGLVKFVPAADHYLNRVEFWTNDNSTTVDIYVYETYFSGTLSGLLASQIGVSISDAGYHSVLLDSPPQLTDGNDVYIKIKFTNAAYGYPLVVDNAGSFETSTCYYSYTGNNGTWSDLGTGYSADLGIRIRTSPTLIASADSETDLTPGDFNLSQNYPNPFNPSTRISYNVGERTRVTITVYNFLGQEVQTLVNHVQAAGDYSATWDGRDADGKPAATGIYFYRIVTDEFSNTRKMLLLR